MVHAVAQRAVAEETLSDAVAVDAEVDDLEAAPGRLEDGRPCVLLLYAAAARERIAEHEHTRPVRWRVEGGVATGTGAEIVRLPPAVGGHRVLARGVADRRVLAHDAGEVVVADAVGAAAWVASRRLGRNQPERR